jgi:hypothetical protein
MHYLPHRNFSMQALLTVGLLLLSVGSVATCARSARPWPWQVA